MNKVDKIKYVMKLEEEKANLERKLVSADKKTKVQKKLASVNKEIKVQGDTCSHISVDLGYYGMYPSTGDEYCCLLCGKGKNREYYYEPRYMVHAENFLPQYDITDDSQCIEKFEHIQVLALEILKENPDMSNEELVSRLNTLIKDSIDTQDTDKNNGPRLIKKTTSKSNLK